MCWIIPLLVGALSALLGYLLGKRCGNNTEALTRLSEENNELRASLNDCEAQKAQFITDSENLLAQHKGDSNAKVAGFSAATTDNVGHSINDAEVTSHQLYLDLQDKYQRTKADLAAKTDVSINSFADSDVEQHQAYQKLLTKYHATQSDNQASNNAKTADLSDADVEKHSAFVALKQKLEKTETDYTTLKTDFDKAEQHNEQTAAMISDLRAENQRISQSLRACENDLKQCQDNLNQADGKVGSQQTLGFANVGNVGNTDNVVEDSFDAAAAKAVFGKKIKENDLTVVEGIGPKISQLFIDAGIATWRKLGETDVADCQKILDDAGDRYTVHNPGTWPRQAKLAADGQWQELFDWQEQLDGGKE